MKAFYKFIFKLFGWEVTGYQSAHIPKKITVVIPHTSNWDFPIGLFTRKIWGMDIKFVIKDSFFKFPFAGIFKWLGGIPVNREKAGNFVNAVVRTYNETEKLDIAIAPEGTRKKVKKLKSGFYYIALKAEIPIILCKFDWGNKLVVFSEPFYPTGDKDKDFVEIGKFFKGVKGKIPANGYIF